MNARDAGARRRLAEALANMGFVVALFGNDSRPYAKVTEEEFVSLAQERGVDITVRCVVITVNNYIAIM